MTSYVYDPKSDIEKQRLLERDKRTSQRRSIALDGLEIPDGSSILDVGCGSGVLGFDLLARFPNSSLFCLDIEPSILIQARRNRPSFGTTTFIASDAYGLPFGGNSFDVVACQYLLQHLADPIRTLREMRRVSKKGALAIIFEWDDGANFIHPPLPAELDKVLEAKIELINRRGGDRNIGRKLYHHLSAAGWEKIEVRLVQDIWQGPDDRSAALKGTELSLLELKSQLLGEALVSAAEFELALEQLYEFFNGDIFSVAFFFAANAINPGM
ncbi:MAG: methyltransferase domain-containing protein [Anaerolineales bacterium]